LGSWQLLVKLCQDRKEAFELTKIDRPIYPNPASTTELPTGEGMGI
jgi:hypothetical protein